MTTISPVTVSEQFVLTNPSHYLFYEAGTRDYVPGAGVTFYPKPRLYPQM